MLTQADTPNAVRQISAPETWQVLRFGRHSGKSLPQVLFVDPDWFFWAWREKKFLDQQLIAEADKLQHRATHINIPDNTDGRLVVEYALHVDQKSLAYVRPVEAQSPTLHRRFRHPYFDLSWPSKHKLFGKRSAQVVVKAVKTHVLKDESAAMTRRRCEGFFENADHFAQ